MKAIVLSFDKQIGFCQLLYKLYMEMWQDCPLTFRIPWNEENPKYFKDKPNVELIHCDSPIQSTMKALLNGIEDEEWVYWCIDDRYPKQILNPNKLTKLHDFLQTSGQLAEFDAVKLYKWKEKLKDSKKYTLLDNTYKIQEDEHQWGFYFHQFCKSKYLKEIFLSEDCKLHKVRFPHHSVLCSKKSLQNIKVLVPNEDDVKFGEPCINGKITPEGEDYLLKYNCDIPDFEKIKRDKKFI